MYAANVENINIDVSVFDSVTDVPHAHKFNVEFNEFYHWETCSICGKCKPFGETFNNNKCTYEECRKPHARVNNGGSMTKCENGAYDNANRDTCNCGWRGNPFVYVHGRAYNYSKGGSLNTDVKFNYANMASYSLSGVREITRAEFNNLGLNTNKHHGDQRYDWVENPNNPGYGWVLCGGPIMSSGDIIGTLEYILGNNGTEGSYSTGFGRNNEFDEIYIIVKYLQFEKSMGVSPSRSRFCRYLNNEFASTSGTYRVIENFSCINNTDHLLYGCRDKYLHRVSDSQFDRIVEEFKGYYIHVSSWGWTGMYIQEPGHNNDGNSLYGEGACYTSTNHHPVSFKDGKYTHCDLCGTNYNGYEDYDNCAWVRCEAGHNIKDGETKVCGSHSISGRDDIVYGYAQCTYKRVGNKVTRTVKATPAPGFRVKSTKLNGVTDIDLNTYVETIPFQNRPNMYSYDYPVWIVFESTDPDKNWKREFRVGYYYVLSDLTAPVPYDYVDNKTNNSHWKILGNGTSQSTTSVRATIYVAFYDVKGHNSSTGQGYSENQLYLTVYDSDQTTKLPQGNGKTEVALSYNSGDIWTGIINVTTEVNGSKNIYVQARDATGNLSKMVPMEISYLDAQGPVITANVTPDANVWSREKVVTVTGVDAFDEVKIGYSQDTMQATTVVNHRGSRSYTIRGNYDGVRNVTFYTQDGSGNVDYKVVKIGNIDNTPPSIYTVDAVEATHDKCVVKVDADDKTSDNKWNGSGIRKMFMSENADMSDPIEHTGDRLLEFEITKTGEYWFRGIDGVDFDSNIKKITLNSWLEDTNRTPEELPEPGNKSQYVQVDDGIGLSHPGYTIQKTIKTVDNNGNIVFDTYYRRNRYSIKYFGNKQTKGETYVQNIMWGQDFEILANKFERVYKYNLVADDDSRLDGDNGDFELEAKIEGGVEQLVETWTFQNWYFDNKNDSDRLASKTYLPGDKISSDSEHLTLKDGDVLTFTVQWEPGTVKLPNVTRTGSDFMGWFNKSQVIGTNDVEARLLGKNEKLTLDDLERRHIQNYDSNKEFTLYAWYNKRPVFVNIYDGVFFEGQKVTYTDLLELIGVWDYNDNYQELQLDNINLHFDNLIEIVDNDISTDRKDLAYLIEDKEDSGDESLLEDIKDLREHINELLKERSEIQKAKRKATQEVKVRKLEPVIAKIEYGALEDEEDYYDSRFGYEYVDYHSEEEASNGLLVAEKKDELGNVIDYDTELLDTSTDKIGLLRITYQVHDDGIYYKDWSELDNEDDGQYGGLSEDFKHSETAGNDIFIPNSDVTIEYTRVCEIDFNYNPLLNLQNILQYSDFDFSNDLGKYVLDRQVLRDSEDLQDNLPWWSKKVGEDLLNGDVNADTQKKLQDSIRITGISEITFNGTFEYEHPDEVNMFLNEYVTPEGDGNGNLEASGLYDKSSILKEIGKFKGNNEAYGSVTKNDIWENITSIGITFDGHDQFGKCASNQVIDDYKSVVDTKKRPIGYISKYNSGFVADESSEEYDLRIYQTPFERTVYLVLINVENDSSLAYIRNKDRIRYINEKYLSGLGNTYWGTTGLADIQKVMDKAQFPEDEDYKEYTGEYEQDNKRKVKVEIKDYTDNE